jgi:hypothetical protein
MYASRMFGSGFRAIVLVLIVLVVALLGPSAHDRLGAAALTPNPKVRLVYQTPRAADLKDVAERVKKRQVLELFGQFLVPLRLPKPLVIQFDQCGAFTRPYQPSGPVTICYEAVKEIERVAASVDPESRQLVLIGTIIQTIFHETATAVFDVLDVPIWGRPDDANDRLAGFLMVEFGSDFAHELIYGTATFFKETDKTWSGVDFADARSPELQRLYNYLCIAYGSEPKMFASLSEGKAIGDFALPTARAGRCKDEFEQVRKAFNLRIMPYVDPDLLVEIRARPWSLEMSLKTSP